MVSSAVMGGQRVCLFSFVCAQHATPAPSHSTDTHPRHPLHPVSTGERLINFICTTLVLYTFLGYSTQQCTYSSDGYITQSLSCLNSRSSRSSRALREENSLAIHFLRLSRPAVLHLLAQLDDDGDLHG